MLPLLEPATDTPFEADKIEGKVNEVESFEAFAASVVSIEAFGGSGRKPFLWIGVSIEADNVSDDDAGDTTRSMSMKSQRKTCQKLREYHMTKKDEQCVRQSCWRNPSILFSSYL